MHCCCAPNLSLFGRRPTVDQTNVAPPSFRATPANASRTSHVLQLHPPFPPASMLRPSNTRRPKWCNIFFMEMPFLFPCQPIPTLNQGGSRGKWLRSLDYYLATKWCNIFLVNRTGKHSHQ